YAKYFGEIKLTQDLLTKKEERSWLLTPPRDGERHDVVLYLGCNVLRTSHLVQTATAVFERLGPTTSRPAGRRTAVASSTIGAGRKPRASATPITRSSCSRRWHRARWSCGARRASSSTTRCCRPRCRFPS